ncbi:MAG: FHA domain-containing protein [Anaerolineae bacterium]|jgi:pSer/pThr/pTyr-binding forkhead associated (FHA) protein|nr:FHA domain-containing protein [Anaerolineae bacterium]
MRICPFCGHKNREGLFFCEDCGQNLNDERLGTTLPTRRFEQQPNELSAKATWGTARFRQGATVLLHIRDANEPLILQPAKRTILGRADTTSPSQPDLDLTPYGALEKGVSRIHAVVERSEDTLTLIDMGSSNGTHLNGQRLMPDQPRVLRDGDEIRLGKLIAHIYFK